MAWIGFIWLRVGTSCRLPCILQWNFGFYKRRLNIWLFERLLSYQEGQYSVELGMKPEVRFYLMVIINHSEAYSRGVAGQRGPRPTHYWSFYVDHTQRRATVGWTPLDEWSAHRRDLYLTAHNTYRERRPCPLWDSNPQSQQASGHWDRPLWEYKFTMCRLLQMYTNWAVPVGLFLCRARCRPHKRYPSCGSSDQVRERRPVSHPSSTVHAKQF